MTALPFDSNRAWEDLRQLVSLGPRPAGSAAIQRSREYIKSQLGIAGVTVAEQTWDAATPLGPVRMVNLIATFPGSRKDRLVIAGHYDTKLFRDFRFVGANDGGSSTAFLIELARVLKTRRHSLTIELLFLDGEEAVVEWRGNDHTYGSRHYVDVARREGSLATLRALILVDMIGDRNLKFSREAHSTPWLVDLIWATAGKQNLSAHFGPDRIQIEDDHLPFLQAGIPSVDIIDFEYPAWHTADDTLESVSARSLQIVGDVVLEAIPAIEARFAETAR
jgi:Zn-dependent M28 family amino/carboxypeptidase